MTAEQKLPAEFTERMKRDLGDEFGAFISCYDSPRRRGLRVNTMKMTPEEFAEKTHKIVNSMLWMDADVYGFCELEAQDIILRQLVDSLNKQSQTTHYAYVVDDIDVAWDSYDNNLKSGFVYRKDKVKPVGSNVPAYSGNYYNRVVKL